jgi:hypothetical protein
MQEHLGDSSADQHKCNHNGLGDFFDCTPKEVNKIEFTVKFWEEDTQVTSSLNDLLHSNLHSPTGPCGLRTESVQKLIVSDLRLKSQSDSCRKTLHHRESNRQLSDEIM